MSEMHQPVGYMPCAEVGCGHELRQHIGVAGPCGASARCPCMGFVWPVNTAPAGQDDEARR